MLIKEIVDIGVAECTEDTSLRDVYDLIQTSSKGYVVVIDSLKHRVPIGIVDEHSICENLIKRSKAAKGLDAGSVLNTNIKRASENAGLEECHGLSDGNVDAILVVNGRRQFLGTVDTGRLKRAVVRALSQMPIFTSIGDQHMP